MTYYTHDINLLKECIAGNVVGVATLLQYKNLVNVNATNEKWQTPLWIAARNGHDGVVELLLKQKDINISARSETGFTPFLTAIYFGHIGVVSILIEAKPQIVNETTSNSITALYIASKLGQESIVKILLKQDEIDINKVSGNGLTPLDASCNLNVTKMLIEQGAIVHTRTLKFLKRKFSETEMSELNALIQYSHGQQDQLSTLRATNSDKELFRDNCGKIVFGERRFSEIETKPIGHLENEEGLM